MKSFSMVLKNREPDQSGINMVDLMMWLVIAALLLATAIQGIGYYQKAAYLYQMEYNLAGAGTNIMTASTNSGGEIDRATAEEGAAQTKWSNNVDYNVEDSSNGGKPYIRATHPSVTDSDVIYLFEACGDYKVGINVVPKTGNTTLDSCGVTASPQSDWETFAGSTNKHWYNMEVSADGTRIIASTRKSDYVYISNDSGQTFSPLLTPGTADWYAFAASADGSKIVLSGSGITWSSIDSGVTWRQTPRTFFRITSSDDGSRMTGVQPFGFAYTSTDYGATWTKQSSTGFGTDVARSWSGVTSSADGMKLAAGIKEGNLSTSSDGGITWVERPSSTSGYWYALASSADGTRLVAGKYQEGIYTSSDSGVTWTKQNSPNGEWVTFSSSADGKTLIAGAADGKLLTSTDYGVTWIPSGLPSSIQWVTSHISADGSKYYAAHFGGAIYTGTPR
jgi:photosystem II stability/assembly factor-like uncharacterized protein